MMLNIAHAQGMWEPPQARASAGPDQEGSSLHLLRMIPLFHSASGRGRFCSSLTGLVLITGAVLAGNPKTEDTGRRDAGEAGELG